MPVYQENSNNVSVMEAVRNGKSKLLLPRILFAFGLFMFSFLGWMFFTILSNAAPKDADFVLKFGLFWIVTFIPFIILPFWFWSKRTTRWKLWAFNKVSNVHELKHFARRAALYANYGSFLDKITIQTKSEREQWADLQSKFERSDIFEDDTAIPVETVMYKSSILVFVNVFFYLLLGGLGLFLGFISIQQNSKQWVCLFPFSLAAWMLYSAFSLIKDLVKHQPQMKLTARGIETIEYGFQSWEVIRNENLLPGSRRDMGWILRYDFPGGNARIDIGWYPINFEKFDHLLRVYRGRYIEGKRKTS